MIGHIRLFNFSSSKKVIWTHSSDENLIDKVFIFSDNAIQFKKLWSAINNDIDNNRSNENYYNDQIEKFNE